MSAIAPVELQRWYRDWLQQERARRGDGVQLSQVHFVRDHLAHVVWRDKSYDDLPRADIGSGYEEVTLAWVIAEHTSKSVRLPVYELTRDEIGLRLTLRNNWYNWNISVESERRIDFEPLRGLAALDFTTDERARFARDGGFKPGRYWDSLFFEGFPDDRRFGPPPNNPRRFSLCMGGDYGLYTIVWLVMNQLQGMMP